MAGVKNKKWLLKIFLPSYYYRHRQLKVVHIHYVAVKKNTAFVDTITAMYDEITISSTGWDVT